MQCSIYCYITAFNMRHMFQYFLHLVIIHVVYYNRITTNDKYIRCYALYVSYKDIDSHECKLNLNK